MRYTPKAIEKKWQQKWVKEKIYEPDLKRARKPFYNLMMFPYPSAEGLHIGAVRTFSGVDIYGRFKRMQGYDVFEPIGLDGFGIHSENYALKVGKHPKQHAKDSEKNFYRQLASIGNGFAWDEKLETYDPKYYKWTQWIFIQMFKKGLAYRKKAEVNWCSSCKTVLADEQVISSECERCSTKVIKKELEQWFFKITDYAERLLNNLDKLDWTESVKIAQRNWIGRSEGSLIKFQLRSASAADFISKFDSHNYIEVFTTRPDTLFGATYLVLGPEHPFVASLLQFSISNFQFPNYNEIKSYIEKSKNKTTEERIAGGKEKTGIELKGIKAINPASNEEIPIWVADYVLGSVGTGAIMAVPAEDKRDLEFAKKFNLPIKENFEKYSGGKRQINYRLRDWLISRQRYWGPPIPMINCDKCGWQPVPEKDLPVKLPYIKNFRPTGTEKAPLATAEKFFKVRCPKCKSWARRETDVSDAFLDSSWYFVGYLVAAHNWKLEIGNWKLQEAIRKWLPVDMYIGGAEHSVLHLLYARFISMAFHDWGMLEFEEPFKVFRAHGLITKDGFKMSKSRGNVVNPDKYLNAYGIDAIRMHLAFLAPLDKGGDFRDDGIKGITRFLERVWKLIFNFPFDPELRVERQFSISKQVSNFQIQKTLHKTIKKVTEDIEGLQYNTAISALMVLLNEFEKDAEKIGKEELKTFLKLLAPFAPFLAEELWQNKFGTKKFKSIHTEKWPEYDEKLTKEEMFELVVQINGKIRDKFEAKIGITQGEAETLTSTREKIKLILGNQKPKKVIYVPNRLINIVV